MTILRSSRAQLVEGEGEEEAEKPNIQSVPKGMKNDVEKWERYYSNEEAAPPWESKHAHAGLEDWLRAEDCPVTKGGNALELGAGGSASAYFLLEMGFHTTCLDISPLAKDRFFTLFPEARDKVNYLVGDCLDLDGKGEAEELFKESVPPKWAKDLASGEKKNLNLTEGFFDLIFDLQCFHVTREIDEYAHVENVFKWCRPGGYVMVVTGAISDHSDLTLDQLSMILPRENGEEKQAHDSQGVSVASARAMRLPPRKPTPGPPKLYKAELVEPFLEHGFSVEECVLTNFNSTPAYLSMSTPEKAKAVESLVGAADGTGVGLRPKKGLMPLAWQAIFRKPTFEDFMVELRS